MKPSFAIGIPTINRYDLLEKALGIYKKAYPCTKIYIIDNGNQNIPDDENVIISRPGNNIGVAASWNRLCKSIFNNHQWAIIVNDDVVLPGSEEFMQVFLSGRDVQFMSATKHMCVFAITKKAYTLVGEFDESFYPAYFEDNDYRYRIKLKNVKSQIHSFLDPIIYHNSMSSQKDNSLGSGFMRNRDYYISKWGGKPGEEIFDKPFNKIEP